MNKPYDSNTVDCEVKRQYAAILKTVDRCYVINEGQVLYHGTPEEVKQHPEVRQKYLGDMDDVMSSQPISRSA